jgi:glutamate-1-semialdehyde 2,1-aminomutase
MNIICIIQARLGSKRFPEKVLQKIQNKTIIELIVDRIKFSKKINHIIVAIPNSKVDNKLNNFLKKKKIKTFRGSENNVLKRYYDAASFFKSDIIVRVTADCPLVDYKIIDKMINILINKKKDYVTNASPPSFPDGLDVEIFNFKSLKNTYMSTKDKYDQEHVTPFLRKSGKFNTFNFSNNNDLSSFRLTVDEKKDLEIIRSIYSYFKFKKKFGLNEIKKFIIKYPEKFDKNMSIMRNSKIKNKGQEKWLKAQKIIPGGNMLLSKRPDLFLPNKWPVYYSKAKGCKVWDIDGKKYIDMALMGVGTNILGYSNAKINKAVFSAISKSNMSSLNCPEEVSLAEKLISLHPWAEMVKFARTGGEANSIAIRIARAASKKDKVAFCGYHGWHDWYLSANLSNKKNLSNQLLPGLEINGVPKSLKNTSIPFLYNDFEGLKKIVNKKNIGIIKMEVMRNEAPKNNFLKKVRKLANEKNIILIFDECTSGFRSTNGGLHKKFKINPDIAIFGKALGNGHAISAIIGKKKIMKHAQDTFISSTFWTERSGSTAALKTLEEMEKIKSWEIITKIGNKIVKGWKKLAAKYKLKIKCFGIPSIKSFEIKSKNWLKYKTLISQEMLKKGFLAGNTIYACIDHNDKILKKYLNCLDQVFKIISKCEKNGQIDMFLETSVCQTGFKRLN